MKAKYIICTAIAMLSFLVLLGTVGGMDLGAYTLQRGVVQALICLAVLIVSAWQAGGFEPCQK